LLSLNHFTTPVFTTINLVT